MHDHRCQRQPLGASLWTYFHDLVETPEEPFEMVGHQLSVLARQMVDALVDGAERAGAALLIEIAAKALRPACGTGAYELRQLSLFRLECSRHGELLYGSAGPPAPRLAAFTRLRSVPAAP